MAAGTAHLRYLRDHREQIYPELERQSDRLAAAINSHCESQGIPARMLNAWSMFHLVFGATEIHGSRDIQYEHLEAEREFYLHLLYHGVIIPGLHIAFLSAAHGDAEVDAIIEAFERSFADIRERGLI